MKPLVLNVFSPTSINAAVKSILKVLNLNENDLVFLDYEKPSKFTPSPNDCHLNVWVQCNYEGGGAISGWMIAEDAKHGFIEAQFHTVWLSLSGELKDITPRMDGEKTIMFFPDPVRKISFFDHEGSTAICSYNNVKMLNQSLISKIERLNIVSTSEFAIKHGFYIPK
jgi:hypothetical protein